MSKNNCEEIIGILWFILSLMLFNSNYIILGTVALCPGIFAMLCSLVFAFQYNRILREAFKNQKINPEEKRIGKC